MIIAESCYTEMIDSPAREIKARVELYDGSTLLETYEHSDALINFTIDRIGESSKFFGYGICQKLTVNLLDKDRVINIVKGNRMEVVVGVGCEYLYTCPVFFVEEVNRDENTNQLTITAYDAVYRAGQHTVSEVDIIKPYTIESFTAACATVLGMPIKFENVYDTVFDTVYDEGGNFNGTEKIRDALNAIAEVTQTIYYMNNNWELTFKRLDKDNPSVLTIDKTKYFTLSSKTDFHLEKIVSATELGDNVYATTGNPGAAQYVRDNPFWSLRQDLGTLLDNAIAAVGGTTINQFDCEWRGNFLLEIGDKISLITKDDQTVTAYLLDDVVTYDGGLKEHTRWDYLDNEGETSGNPSTLGAALNRTYAKVDKINNEISLVASNLDSTNEAVSSLVLTTEDITASVKSVETIIDEGFSSVNGEIETLTKQVSATMTSEDVKIAISSELSNGVSKVTTSTGYTFNQDGLTVSKSDSEISTTISEDGMIVQRSGETVLIANNEGVKAEDLHATTYLIVGNNSRFEDFTNASGQSRTGCFWIG